MALYALCLYNGEKYHLSKSIEKTKSIADKVYIFTNSENMKSAMDFVDDDVFICELEWNHNFAELRNKAIDVICEEAKEDDWILSIDADECLDIENFWKLNSAIDMIGSSSNICAFEIEIVNNDKDWPCDYLSANFKRSVKNTDIRVFKASKLVRYSGRINEKITLNPALVSKIDFKIYHHANRYSDDENFFLIERRHALEKWNSSSDEFKMNFIEKEQEIYKKLNSSRLFSITEENEKPRLGFFCLHYDPPIGGAERSMQNYFSIIKDDFIIDVFCFLDENGRRFKTPLVYEKDGISITRVSDEISSCFNKYVREKKPDIIGTQLLCSEQIIDLAYKNDIPSVYFAHGLFEDVCQHYLMTTCPETNLATCSFGSHCPNVQRHKTHLDKYSKCSKIFCNSNYTLDILKRFFPSESEKMSVISPNFRYELFKPQAKALNRERNRILAINTASTKGLNVVVNLAFTNPDLKFIYVDSKTRDLARIPVPSNIDFRAKMSSEEMAKIYNDVDVVLCPTLMDETFGGVVCEAVLSGTPVVCSGKGNLPNLVSNEKNGYIIYNDYTTETWDKYLKKALTMEIDLSYIKKLALETDIIRNSKILIKEIKNVMINKKDIFYRPLPINVETKEKNNGRKILFFARFGYPALGGGEHMLHSVLKYLQKLGYDCEMACYFNGKTNQPFREELDVDWDGIPVKQAIVRSNDDFKRIIHEKQPDLVITQSYDAINVVKAAKDFGAKTILGTHFWRNICDLIPPEETFLKMLSRSKESVKLLTKNHPVFHMADECYVNSEFMQKAVEKYVGKKIDKIIQPMADLDRILSNQNTKEYITLINPDFYKGGDFFVKIAEKMPLTRFMCVGRPPDIKGNPKNKKINDKISNLHNIKLVENTDDMKDIYGKTSILLVPSIVDETFSMVALEAMWNGIPVIVSQNGNLPYLVDDASIILDMYNINTWIESIKTLNEDEEYYDIISKQCKERALKFTPDMEFYKFYEMVKSCLGE